MAIQITHPAGHIETIDTSRFECLDGQLIERPAPTIDHSMIQQNLAVLLGPIARSQNRKSGPEYQLTGVPVPKATG